MAATLVHTSTAHTSREAGRARGAFAAMAALAEQRRAARVAAEQHAAWLDQHARAAREAAKLIELDGPDATYGVKLWDADYGKVRLHGLSAREVAWHLADPTCDVDGWCETTSAAL